ncbi:MAG TPA: methyltransferase domain-containing protein [Bryobacteraceae bacterium]|nr:methyltransferase domain-containing protein [Bryobacteraceae bacterium]
MLICPVRGCHLPLAREKRRVGCARAHSFDIARSGYINLLQPQDRRSKRPGDTADAVKARRRLEDLGITKPLLDSIAELLAPSPDDTVLDAGCGNGGFLGSLAGQTGFDAHGVDISVAAIEAAARRFPLCQWIVANVDRFIPYSDSSFSILLSITARMNVNEFRRVLRNNGRLLVAIPAPDDLIELRRAGRERVERTVATFAPHFAFVAHHRATSTADLDASAVRDVLHSVYRPLRAQPAQAMRLTFSFDLLLFHPS